VKVNENVTYPGGKNSLSPSTENWWSVQSSTLCHPQLKTGGAFSLHTPGKEIPVMITLLLLLF